MNEDQTLATLRAAERILLVAYRWLPYGSDLVDSPGERQQLRHQDDLALDRDEDFIRERLKETEVAVLNIAEHRGSKS